MFQHEVRLCHAGKLAASVRPEGVVLVYGAMGGIVSNNISIRDTLFRGVSVTGFWLSRYMKTLGEVGTRKMIEEVIELLASGILKPRTGKFYACLSAIQTACVFAIGR